MAYHDKKIKNVDKNAHFFNTKTFKIMYYALKLTSLPYIFKSKEKT